MNKEQFMEACKTEKSYGDCYYAVYDNFLPYQEFGLLKDYMESRLGYTLSGKINYNDTSNSDFYLARIVYHNEVPAREQWNPQVDIDPFINISSKLHVEALLRIKANLYAGSKEINIHAPHVDYDFPHTGALFYVTDCDAPTYLADGTEVESKANRLLIFNSGTPHSSSAPTNVPYRITINFNYFGAGPQPRYLLSSSNHLPTMMSNNYPFETQMKNMIIK